MSESAHFAAQVCLEGGRISTARGCVECEKGNTCSMNDLPTTRNIDPTANRNW